MKNTMEPTSKIRTEIREGYISEATRALLRELLSDLNKNRQNSWDENFCESMSTYRKKLSNSQIEHLERIIEESLLKIEYPNGLPKDFLGF